jgi:hypothetical protein
VKGINLKEYNQWELRFLQVLVPKKKYMEIMVYNASLMMDKSLFRGDGVIGHPNDKIEFIDAKTDYLDSINSMIKAFKKHGVPKMDVGWAIIPEEDKNDN